MKKPDEIKKGLDICIGEDERCAKCSYVCYGDCRTALEVDALKYIQQLERERDAAVGSLKRYAACLDCTHYRQEAFGYQQPICQGCKFGSNWQWRGPEVE